MKSCVPFLFSLFPSYFRVIALLSVLVLLAHTGVRADDRASNSLTTDSKSALTAPASVTVTPAATTVCAGVSVPLTLTGCPVAGTVRWSTGQTGTTISPAPTQTTSYTATCTVPGPQESTTAASATITVNQPPTITAGPTPITACEGGEAKFIVSVVSSAAPTYAWRRNGISLTDPTADNRQLSLTNIRSAVHTGDYTIVVTNQCGSVTSPAGRLTVAQSMTVTNTITPASCSGTGSGQIVVAVAGGSGNKQYQLNGQAFQTSNVFSNLRSGTYTVGVKDALGCLVQNSAVVTQPNSITLAFRAVSPKCVGGADGGLIVTATGGNGTYQYQLNGGTPQGSDTFFDLKSGSYSVTATDRLGCSTSQSVLIGTPNPLDIRPVVTPTRCVGSADGSVNVVVAGGAGSYQYQLGGGAFQSGTLFTGLAASTYEFTVKDANGCLGKQTATVPQPAPLNLTATSTPVNCFGANSGSITVTPSGGTGAMSYQLTTARTSQTSNVFKNIAIGDYTVVATDANGCTALAPVTVGKSEPLTVRAAPIPATCCVCPTGGAILATGGGTGTGRLFQLSGQPFQAGNQFGGLKPGTYRFRVSDEAGCLDSVTTVITDASAMSLTAGRIKDIACAGGSDGEAAVQITGGTKPFTFFWQTERKDTLRARTPTQTGLTEGTYTVSVVDSNRCTAATAFVTVRTLNPLPPKPVIAQVSNILSVTEVTGIQWYVRGDTGVARPIPNATLSTLTPVASGRYYVIVTQNGCASPPSDLVSFVLTALPEPGKTLSVRVMPNPVTDRLRLEMEQAGRQAVQVQLIDASGRSVFRQRIPPFTGQLQTEWPLAGIPPGLYLLKAEAGVGQAILRVLVE